MIMCLFTSRYVKCFANCSYHCFQALPFWPKGWRCSRTCITWMFPIKDSGLRTECREAARVVKTRRSSEAWCSRCPSSQRWAGTGIWWALSVETQCGDQPAQGNAERSACIFHLPGDHGTPEIAANPGGEEIQKIPLFCIDSCDQVIRQQAHEHHKTRLEPPRVWWTSDQVCLTSLKTSAEDNC